MRDLDEEDPAEVEASKFDLNYIPLDGNIGCLVNGAGLAMATMDIIKLYGGSPANFLDVGGGATAEKVTEAFKIMLRNPKLKAIFVNIFGGIMKCDVDRRRAWSPRRSRSGLKVPLVVRLEGTNVELGKKILAESGLPIISGGQHGRRARRRSSPRRRAEAADMSILDRQEHARHHPGHHRQDRRSSTPSMCTEYANGTNCFVAGVTPEEGRRGLRGHPDLRHGEGSEGSRPARTSR